MADLALEQTKQCSKCGTTKPVTRFSRDKHKKSGYKSCCLACDKLYCDRFRANNPGYSTDHREKNPEMYRAAGKRWRDRNPDKVREWEAKRPPRDPEQRRAYNQEYHRANRVQMNAASRSRYAAEPEKRREYAKAYKAANPDVVSAWIESNRDKIRASDARRRSTPKGRIDDRMSSGIRQALGDQKAGRKWEALVGYSLDDLVRHLEGKFRDGMSWQNIGDWHIDHVIPKSKFNYESPEHIDFKRCWALSNLQPLWAADNIRKYNKLSTPFQPSLAI